MHFLKSSCKIWTKWKFSLRLYYFVKKNYWFFIFPINVHFSSHSKSNIKKREMKLKDLWPWKQCDNKKWLENNTETS